MRDLVGLSWDVVALAYVALVPLLLIGVAFLAFQNRSLRHQLAEADEEIDDLLAARNAGAVRFLEIRHHG